MTEKEEHDEEILNKELIEDAEIKKDPKEETLISSDTRDGLDAKLDEEETTEINITQENKGIDETPAEAVTTELDLEELEPEYEPSAAAEWAVKTQDAEGEIGEEVEEGHMGEADPKSVEIEIPDLYQDTSEISLPELTEDDQKKEHKDERGSELIIAAEKSDYETEEMVQEEGMEYEETSALEEGEPEEQYQITLDKEKIKKVEIIESIVESSDSDAFLSFIGHEEKREEIKEKPEKKRDPREEYGVGILLKGVIDKAVEKSEHVDPETILRVKLDRYKLVRAFKVVLAEMQEEEKKRLMLNSKVIEYFKKKNVSRALAEDNPENILDSIKRYRDCLTRLDRVRARDSALKEELKQKLYRLEKEQETLTADCNTKVENLNKRIKEVGLSTTSIKTGQPMSEKTVDGIIKKMNHLRDQISALRLNFIRAQHKIATLVHEAKRLEDIGEGLKMVDFEQLRAETQGLGDKVEERNNELAKLRERCNADTHFLAHIREKQYMLNQKIMQQEETLSALKDELNYNRNLVNKLKLERDSVRKRYNELSYESGLLDKPNLLHDYDDTVKQIKIVQRRVNNLKETRAKMMSDLGGALLKLDE